MRGIPIEGYLNTVSYSAPVFGHRPKLRRRLILVYSLILLDAALLGFYLREGGLSRGRSEEISLERCVLWGGGERDYPRSITIHGDYLFVTGSTSSWGAGDEDVFLLKYSSQGDLIWNLTWGREGNDMGRDIAASDDGIYVGGITNQWDGTHSLLLKYDLDGRLIWSRMWRPLNEDAYGRAVAVDGGGSAYIVGYTRGNVTRGFAVKYSTDGALIWDIVDGETGADYFWDVVECDNLYVSGSCGGEAGAGSATMMTLSKLSLDGKLVWKRRMGFDLDSAGLAITVREADIYQVGFTRDTYGDSDALMVINQDTGESRAEQWGGPGEDYAWGVASGGDYIYYVGHTHTEEPLSESEALITKCDLDGNLIWNVTWGGMGPDIARSVVINGDDVYVVGITPGRSFDGQAFLLWYNSPNRAFHPTRMYITVAGMVVVSAMIAVVLAHGYIHRTGLEVNA